MNDGTAPESDSRNRIIDAARRLIDASGWEFANSGRIAGSAGVSKALIHYHFGTKASLLWAVAESCRGGIAARMRRASLSEVGRENPVDDFADWAERELAAQDMRIALQLTMATDATVREAAAGALTTYHEALEREVHRVFAALDLQPRLAAAIFVDAFINATEGMAITRRGPRPVIEALWLSLLTLTD